MSPTPLYSLMLVLAVTLFLTATSLADDQNHQPSAASTFENELSNSVPPKRGGGRGGIGQVKYDPKPQKESGHHQGGGDGKQLLKEELTNKPETKSRPIEKPGGPHDPHINREFNSKSTPPGNGKNVGHSIDVETAKEKYKSYKPHIGN